MASAPTVRRPRSMTRRGSTTTALARRDEDVLEIVDAEVLPAVRGRGVTRVIRLTTGWMIFGVGVIFVILPVIPGTPLVILAAFMLAPDVPMFARVLDWSKTRFSHVTTSITDVQERFAEDFHRRFST